MAIHRSTTVSKGILFLTIILFLSLVGCGSSQDLGSGADSLPAEINVEQAFTAREAGAFMLDVREPDEWQQAHIPGATLIPLGELQKRISELPNDQEIVVYCRSGNRSKSGRDILREAGFGQVSSMAGGINDWQAAGYPTVSGP